MIEFDEENHIYKVDGRVKRSVTQVLRDAGILDDYSGIPPYYMERGTLVHEYCELYAQGWLDMDTVREDCIEYVRAFADIVFRLGLEYVSSETAIYDPEYDICGTYDLIMMWDDKRTLVEIKTGVAPMWLGIQMAAYDRVLQTEAMLGLELKTGKIYEPADDFILNTVAWDDIINGTFDYEAWKSDRKRRRMKVLK